MLGLIAPDHRFFTRSVHLGEMSELSTPQEGPHNRPPQLGPLFTPARISTPIFEASKSDLQPINLLPFHGPNIHLAQTVTGDTGNHLPFHQVGDRTQRDRLEKLGSYTLSKMEEYIANPENHMGITSYNFSEIPIEVEAKIGEKRKFTITLQQDPARDDEEVRFHLISFFAIISHCIPLGPKDCDWDGSCFYKPKAISICCRFAAKSDSLRQN